jgi:hypothetical protein
LTGKGALAFKGKQKLEHVSEQAKQRFQGIH